MKRRKFIYAICILGIIALNVLYVDYQFYMLLMLMIVIPLISLVLFILSKIGLRIRMNPSKDLILLKDNAVINIETVNRLPIYLSESELELVESYSEDDKLYSHKVNVATFRDKLSERITITPKHCGIMKIETGLLKSYDYLKFFNSVRKYYGEVKVAVMPEIYEGYPKDVPEGITNASIEPEESIDYLGNNEEITDLREYQDGDDYRHIHWKLSSMQPEDNYIVKQYSRGVERCNLVIVDLLYNSIKGNRDVLDKIYSVAYSVGVKYCNNRLPASYIVWNEKNNRMETMHFSNLAELDKAIIDVMTIGCIKGNDDKLNTMLERLGYEDEYDNRPIIITASDYLEEKRGSKFKVINVLNKD